MTPPARSLPAVAVVALLLAGCVAGDPPASSPTTPPSPTAPDCGDGTRAELLGMLERDQAGRAGESDPEGDRARTTRLGVILDACGWPGFDAVGEEAEDAAWAIAQHSDHDVGFQRRALALLAEAVAAGDASPGNLAYLTDRVAANSGEPQTYGTQIGCVDGGPVPGVPIRDEAEVDARRAAVGLAPLADYFAELAEVCAAIG